jgi:hypothetical protein
MHQGDPDLEQRLSRFQAQLDRFSLTLHQWQQTQEHLQTVNPRDVDQRFRMLEETIDREAHALRRLHEEPLKQLQAQTASLRDICVAATNSVNGLDQAESRFAALQADLHLHMNELARNLQAIVADLRIGGSTAVSTQGPAAAWPLERVVHLHNELRRAADGGSTSSHDPSGEAATAFPRQAAPQLSAATQAPGGRVLPPEHEVTTEREESSGATDNHGSQRRRRYIAGVLITVAAALVAFAVEQRIETRLNDAIAHVTAAERQAAAATELANQQIISTRQEADRQINQASLSAQRAETIGAVLTAPDLVRFNLSGGPNAERSSAQVLWSRTRGLVLSASRLPAAPPESVYQLWLWTSAEPISGGLFVPDATGRASLMTDDPPKVTGPVVGVVVTVEPSGGRPTPSGPRVLARLPLS